MNICKIYKKYFSVNAANALNTIFQKNGSNVFFLTKTINAAFNLSPKVNTTYFSSSSFSLFCSS